MRRLLARLRQAPFPYRIGDSRLVYVPAPKNACTSLKKAVHVFNGGEVATPGEPRGRRPSIHRRYPSRPIEALSERPDDLLFCLVREPVGRFLSAFCNRVLHHGDLVKDKVGDRGLNPRPSINELVEKLDAYRGASRRLAWHTHPQVFFLGSDPARYWRIRSLAGMDELQSDIEAELGRPFPIRHDQTGGSEHKARVRTDITDESRLRLEAFYRADEEVFSRWF